MKYSKFIFIALSLVALVSCENVLRESEDLPHRARPSKQVISVSVEAQIDSHMKESIGVVLGDQSECMDELWKWSTDDVVYAVYVSDGLQDICSSRSITIEQKDSSKAVIVFDQIPFDAQILSLEVGGNTVFGHNVPFGTMITKKMAYLRGEVEAEIGQKAISNVVLKNICNYLLVDLSNISFYGIRFDTKKVYISGKGLCGGESDMTICLDYEDVPRQKTIVAVNSRTTSLSVEVDFAEGKKQILEMESFNESPLVICVNDVPDDTPLMTVTANATLGASSKAACTDSELSIAAQNLWTWKSDDKVLATVEIHGYSGKIPCNIVNVDELDNNKAQIIFNSIPVEAVIKELSLGTNSAYGQVGKSANGIPREMIYASAEVISTAGEEHIGGIDLQHECSYLNVMADKLTIDGQQYDVNSISVSGLGVKDDGEPSIINLSSDSYSDCWWVSVSKRTTLLSVVASYSETAALLYSEDEISGISKIIKVRADNPKKAVFRTVLFNDGTLIVNQISAYANIDKALHNGELAVYPPLDSEHNYQFLDQNAPYYYLEGEEIPENEDDRKFIIDDLRDIEDVEAYFKNYYGETEGKARISALWEDNKSKIKKVQFGSTVRPKSMNIWFRNCSNLESVDVVGLDLSQCNGLWGTFMDCHKLKNIDVSGWNISQVETLSQIFNNCKLLEVLDVADWNTSKVMSFSRAFEGCDAIKSLEVGSWDMSASKTIRYIFAKCKRLTQIDVKNWNVSNVTNFVGVFEFCASLESIDVSKWNTSSAKNSFFKLFCDCSLLKELDLRSWDISGVREFDNLFSRCSSIKTIDLTGWKSTGIEKCGNMFRQCFSLETVYTDADFDVTKLYFTMTKGMFYQCSSLRGGLGTRIPEEKLQSDINPECSGRYFGRVDIISEDGTHLPGVFTLKK